MECGKTFFWPILKFSQLYVATLDLQVFSHGDQLGKYVRNLQNEGFWGPAQLSSQGNWGLWSREFWTMSPAKVVGWKLDG